MAGLDGTGGLERGERGRTCGVRNLFGGRARRRHRAGARRDARRYASSPDWAGLPPGAQARLLGAPHERREHAERLVERPPHPRRGARRSRSTRSSASRSAAWSRRTGLLRPALRVAPHAVMLGEWCAG
jgi:hypothetical protein